MNYTAQAIKLAIENGYGPSWWRSRIKERPDFHTEWTGYEWEEVFSSEAQRKFFLDPLFWQALGKGLGWDKEPQDACEECGASLGGYEESWHSFIDHLAEGKDPESFFKNILPPQSQEKEKEKV